MDRPAEEITKKADQYAKRLSVRKKDPNQSFELFSKSLRRRKKIMDAISKKQMTSSAKPNATDKDELTNSNDEEVDKSYVSTWPECSVDDNLSAESCSRGAARTGAAEESCATDKSLGVGDANCGNVHKRQSSAQVRRDFLAGLLHAPSKHEPKISLGEYFGAKSHKEMRTRNFVSKSCEKEFEYYKVDASKRKAEQDYMQARVLELQEPEVVHVERKSSHSDLECPGQDSLQPSAPPMEADSSPRTSSFVSGDSIERQAEGPRAPPETPKTAAVYPNLLSMERRMSEHCTKRLFGEDAERTPAAPPDESFSTPMPMSSRQMEQLERRETSPKSLSFLKRNASFLFGAHCFFGHGRTPRRRRQSNMDSTRWQPPAQQQRSGASGEPPSGSQNATCTISTLTLPATPSSPAEGSRRVPLEVADFLKVALGEEHSPQHTASELFSERDFGTPAGESRRSEQPGRAAHLVHQLRNSFKRKFNRRSARGEEPQRPGLRAVERPLGLEDSVRRLLDLMELYQTHIYQTSKALGLCQTMREFETSPERVELERLLLVASVGKASAREQIRRQVGPEAEAEDRRAGCERAKLALGELSLRLPGRRERAQDEQRVDWLLVVASEGLSVWASEVVACPPGGPGGSALRLPGELELPGLGPGFRLSLGVYAMQLRPAGFFSHEDKYHIREGPRRRARSCPSPRGCAAGGPAPSPRQHAVRFSGIRESAFKLCARLELGLDSLEPPRSAWPLDVVDENSMLRGGCLGMSLKCRLQMSLRHAGFLTHGDEPGGLIAWSRRWCVLEGARLLFWNYPREQEDDRPALYAIDLTDCLSRRIELADRSLCPRPRTLLVETARRRSPVDEDSVAFQCQRTWTIVRNLLSCDTHQDLIEWQSKLNHVVSALREWNLIDNKPLQISDL